MISKRTFAMTATGFLLVFSVVRASLGQSIAPASHATSGTIVQSEACAACTTCQDCLRVTTIKKTPHPEYSQKIKDVCVPSGLFSWLFGGPECQKIEVRQLVKKIRIDEQPVTRCATPEEAAKIANERMTRPVGAK